MDSGFRWWLYWWWRNDDAINSIKVKWTYNGRWISATIIIYLLKRRRSTVEPVQKKTEWKSKWIAISISIYLYSYFRCQSSILLSSLCSLLVINQNVKQEEKTICQFLAKRYMENLPLSENENGEVRSKVCRNSEFSWITKKNPEKPDFTWNNPDFVYPAFPQDFCRFLHLSLNFDEHIKFTNYKECDKRWLLIVFASIFRLGLK